MNKLLILSILISGIIIFCLCNKSYNLENFENQTNDNDKLNDNSINNLMKPIPSGAKIPLQNCPNILIQRDNQLYLFNSNLARIPGINPVVFRNLEDYAEFVRWQRSQNINCPILFLQNTLDTQNNSVYRVCQDPFRQPNIVFRTNIFTERNNLNPLEETTNQSSSSKIRGFDPNNQKIGVITPLDKMFTSSKDISPNPMDTNWGGHEFTQNLIDQGAYDDQKVFDPKHIEIARKEDKKTGSNNAMDPNWKGAEASYADFGIY